MRFIAIVAAAALLGGTTFAQGVPDGSDWTDGEGYTVTVDVVDTNPDAAGCTVQMTDATGFGSSVTGTASSNSTTEKPKADSAPVSTTPGGNELDIKKGTNGNPSKVRLKKNGKWVYLRRTKTRKNGLQQPPAVVAEPSLDGPESGGSLPPERL